jgi:hypothetical protein
MDILARAISNVQPAVGGHATLPVAITVEGANLNPLTDHFGQGVRCHPFVMAEMQAWLK